MRASPEEPEIRSLKTADTHCIRYNSSLCSFCRIYTASSASYVSPQDPASATRYDAGSAALATRMQQMQQATKADFNSAGSATLQIMQYSASAGTATATNATLRLQIMQTTGNVSMLSLRSNPRHKVNFYYATKSAIMILDRKAQRTISKYH